MAGPWATRERALLLLVAAAALAVLGGHFVQAFAIVPDMAFPESGTPWAPHSDALGPWLQGGLAYLFGLPPPSHLYRPTIALYWGSLLAATGHIEAISFFFTGWLFALCASLPLSRSDRTLRVAMLMLLAFAALRFPEEWQRVKLNVDLAALVLSLTGALLALWDTGRSRIALYVGCACLGVAAAIRGPLMLAGPLLIGMRVLALDRPHGRTLAWAAAFFLAPIAIDIGMQRYLGTANNAMQALYCVYADASHTWTPQCRLEYLRLQPPAAEILARFFGYIVGFDAIRLVLAHATTRVGYDLALLASPAPLAAIGAIAALASGGGTGRYRPLTPFVKSLWLVASLVPVAFGSSMHPWLAPAWVIVAAIVAAYAGNWRACGCLCAFLAGTLFLHVLGLLEDRLQYTFGFLLVLGVGLLVSEDRVAPGQGPDRLPAVVASCAAAALVFLYGGSFVLHSAWRETYLREVYMLPNMALKIGDDPRIDRSLYYSWERRYIYTRHDDVVVGGVRHYGSLANGALDNASFKTPNAFVD